MRRFFSQKETKVERKVVLIRIKFHEILAAFANDTLINGSLNNVSYTMVGWWKLYKGWCKVNIDRRVTREESRAGTGGIIRNES